MFWVQSLPVTCQLIIARLRWGSRQLIPTTWEPNRAFPEPLSPCREFHIATVGCVFRLVVGIVVAGTCMASQCHSPLLVENARDQYSLLFPVVWLPAACVVAQRQPTSLASYHFSSVDLIRIPPPYRILADLSNYDTVVHSVRYT